MRIDVPSQLVDVQHKRPALKALTSIRFFAAIYVVLFHLHFGFNTIRVPLVANFMASGYNGVTLFFVLSGFILAYNYAQVRHPRQFWVARFARIYPVYALSLILSLLRPALWHQPRLLAGGILDFALLQAWWIPLYSSINSAAWTLSIEAFFYAVFPLLLPWLQTMRPKRFWLIQSAYFAFLCLPVLMKFSQFAHQGVQLAEIIEGPFPLFRLNTFVVGVYFGNRFLAQRSWTRERQQSARPNHAGIAASVLLSFALLCMSPLPVLLPVRTLLLTYTFLWLILGLTQVQWSILTNHWMQIAGEISYGIYILQFPIGFMAEGLWHRWAVGIREPVLLHVAIVVLVSYASFRWFEIPARLTIRRVLTGHQVLTRPI